MISCFEVESIFPYREGFGLAGRCVSGPIRRGDTFIALFKTQAIFAEDRTVSLDREMVGEICLIVQDVQYFNHSVEELQTDCAGGLYVTGVGAELLIQGAQIETAS